MQLPSALPIVSELAPGILSSIASPFLQDSRLFTLHFPEDSGIAPELLLPLHLRGVERISAPFFYQVEALSPSVHLYSTDFIGQPVSLSLLQDDGSERCIAGIVTVFRQLDSDGGAARYELHIEPFLALLAHSWNACVRQDMPADEIIRDVLSHHRKNNPIAQRAFEVEFRLSAALPPLSYSVQHENDLHYIERLIAQYGLFYFFEFRDNDGHPVHVLVISDTHYPRATGVKPVLRFAGANAKEDTVTQWSGMRRIQPGMVSLTSFEYKGAQVDSASAQSAVDQGTAGNALASTLHDFDPQTHYYARGGDDLERHARLRQDAYDFQTQRYTGVTSARSVAPATSFELRGHPVHDQDYPEQRSFTIVSLACEARNNLAQEAETTLSRLLQAEAETPAALAPWFGHDKGLLDDPRRQPYRNVIECVQRDVSLRMPYARTAHARPTAPASVTATVVGPAGEEVYTDERGRVQIEFDFEQHVDNLAPGSTGKTPFRCWVRVMALLAGNQWGTQFIPRVGMEVLVIFLNGDWDRMICLGALSNGTHPAPHFSDAGSLPNNKMQSGIKTKEDHGWGYNQLLLDDTAKQLSAQLMSTHANTQLNQGWLGTARRDGESTPRGEGLELITQAAAVLRSVGPLLLSTEPARQGEAQLARRALSQMLAAALSLADSFGELAAAAGANQPETGRGNHLMEEDAKPGARADAGHQTQVKEAVDNLERGYNNDREGKSGSGEQRGGQGVIALSAVQGAAIASQKSITVAAGTNVDQTALRDTNQTTGRRWIHNVRESVSLFVDGAKAKIKESFKIIAAHGNIKLQAQDGKIEAAAQGNFTITSVNGKVVITAPEEILLAAGGGYVRIGKNIEIHNPGNQSQKAGGFALGGPVSMPPELPRLPKTPVEVDHAQPLYSQQFDFSHLIHHEEDLSPISKNKSYAAYDKQGNLLATGMTDSHGQTDRIFTNEPKDILLVVDEGEWNLEEHFELQDDMYDEGDEENKEEGEPA